MTRNPTAYILASQRNGTLYIGVTSDPVKRIWQHKHDAAEGFTKKYRAHLLVYFEQHARMDEAISVRNRSRSGIAHGSCG